MEGVNKIENLEDLNNEWLEFTKSSINQNNKKHLSVKVSNKNLIVPKCSQLYVSTQTKIAFLNSEIDIYNIFWKLPVILVWESKEGIIKKSIKINCDNIQQTDNLENNINDNKDSGIYMHAKQLKKIIEKKGKKEKYKDVRKIEIGLSNKDILSYRKNDKGAFYNCFALILRIKYEDSYKEVHIKVFNTGKLEIPGIQNDDLLFKALKLLIKILNPFTNESITYKENISTVLINSNFNCGFFINRNKLYDILKYEYNIHSIFDPCSYPGIQCKFYYDKIRQKEDGKCCCEKQCGKDKTKKRKKEIMTLSTTNKKLEKLKMNYNNILQNGKNGKKDKKTPLTKKEMHQIKQSLKEINNEIKKNKDRQIEIKNQKKCIEISFMIFRTGSILIVGNCEKDILDIVYKFISNILKKEYSKIYIESDKEEKKKKAKKKKKLVLFVDK
tara:strand:+ start:4107 stop:5432 length:1326 start_codon:yes stop_codon:yes gene_type:complete